MQHRRTAASTDTRAATLRRARTCYDHLAGRFGVAVLASLIEQGALVRTDGGTGVAPGTGDGNHTYALGPAAAAVFGRLGVDLDGLLARPRSTRPLVRCCVDWTEQRYHLAGALGAAVLARAETAHWVSRRSGTRSIDVTDAGRRAFQLGE